MKKMISETQTAHFTKMGSIEFEIPYPALTPSKRDQWREEKTLKSFILKTLGPIGLALTGKNQLRLGFSEWILEKNRPQKAGLLKEMVSIQNLALGISIATHPNVPKKRSPLGILPIPTASTQILFFKPTLILDWPHVASDFLLILFTLPNTVYIHNPKDPETTYLKELGYEYGDTLKNETHPLIFNH